MGKHLSKIAGVAIGFCTLGCGSGSGDTQGLPGTETQAVREICTGEDRFTFQRVNSNKLDGSLFGILWRNGMGYLRVDGHCNYFVYMAYRNEPVLPARCL